MKQVKVVLAGKKLRLLQTVDELLPEKAIFSSNKKWLRTLLVTNFRMI
jgi:hypothetical protein